MEPFRSIQVPERTTDIFYSAYPSSPAREEATYVLRQMKAEGYKIDIPEGRIMRSEFLHRLGAAWVTVSPEGSGWHTYRHYEAGLLGTVPVINYPSPPWAGVVSELRGGEHCFHYQVGDGSLHSVLKQALADKERLMQMGQSLQMFCQEHNTREAVARYILEMLGVKGSSKIDSLA